MSDPAGLPHYPPAEDENFSDTSLGLRTMEIDLRLNLVPGFSSSELSDVEDLKPRDEVQFTVSHRRLSVNVPQPCIPTTMECGQGISIRHDRDLIT